MLKQKINDSDRRLAHFGLAAALILACGLYWPGLSGPYLFDDFWNLSPVEGWLEGSRSWKQAMLPNTDSFIASRPVAMASFMLSMWMGGLGPFPIKLGNLAIHLFCGLAGCYLLRQLMMRDPLLSRHAGILALVTIAVWLIHPLHVSTVLYAVQRMTQLSTLFTLVALGLYVHARNLSVSTWTWQAVLALLLVPMFIGLGVLSKQNAVIAPFLCLLIELAYFSRSSTDKVPLGAFYSIFVILPTVALAAWLPLNMESLEVGFRDWDFTMGQRLLSQPRALVDYMSNIVVPYAPSMGLYTDDFAVSKGLLDPVTTILSIALLTAGTLLAIGLRRRSPSFFAGWFFFLVAHSVESSFLPIEIYYEHRNYLPSLGLMLASVGIGSLVPFSKAKVRWSPRRIVVALTTALVVALSIATLGRVLVWQHSASIVEQGVIQHPQSLHAIFDKASYESEHGNFSAAELTLQPLLASKRAKDRAVGKLYLVALGCVRGAGFNSPLLESAVLEDLPRITVYEAQMMKLLDEAAGADGCRGMSEERLAHAFSRMLDKADTQLESTPNKFVIRELVARLYARAGNWTAAQHQAELAWKNGSNPPAGAMLIRILLKNGNVDQAAQVLPRLISVIDPDDREGQAEIKKLLLMIEQQRA